jgi:hypothetical protein
MPQLLHVTFEVQDDVDMAREDPEELALDLLSLYEVDVRANGLPRHLRAVLEASWDSL